MIIEKFVFSVQKAQGTYLQLHIVQDLYNNRQLIYNTCTYFLQCPFDFIIFINLELSSLIFESDDQNKSFKFSFSEYSCDILLSFQRPKINSRRRLPIYHLMIWLSVNFVILDLKKITISVCKDGHRSENRWKVGETVLINTTCTCMFWLVGYSEF